MCISLAATLPFLTTGYKRLKTLYVISYDAEKDHPHASLKNLGTGTFLQGASIQAKFGADFTTKRGS